MELVFWGHEMQNYALEYGYINGDLCYLTCVGASVSKGGIQLTWTRVGCCGAGLGTGLTSVTGDKTTADSSGGCVSFVVGPCYNHGATVDGGEWHGGGITFGEKIGVQGGPTKSWCILFCP